MLAIRQWQPSDRDAILDLHARVMDAAGVVSWRSNPWYRDLFDIPGEYITPGGDFLVGEEDGELAVMGGLRPRTPEEGEICRVRVDPGRQRFGHGRRMLGALEARASELGFARVTLSARPEAHGAQRLYKAEGYCEVGWGRRGGLDLLQFEKWLR